MAEMEPESKLLEEYIREASSIGDYDTVTELIRSGVNINSQNSMNGWTALHWAARRNHRKIVELLMRNGANPLMKNNNGETPGNVTWDKEIQTVLGVAGPVRSPKLPFTPAYLKYPSLPVSRNLKLNREISASNSKHNLNESIVLKVRIAGSDPDFIEVELNKAELTVQGLVKVCCKELNVESEKIKKIRKLPNTLIRKGRDIERLSDYQEIELCCM